VHIIIIGIRLKVYWSFRLELKELNFNVKDLRVTINLTTPLLFAITENLDSQNKIMINGRALHFVFKIGERKLTAKFYREILGMKVNYLEFVLI
jgi:hypothetical protein